MKRQTIGIEMPQPETFKELVLCILVIWGQFAFAVLIWWVMKQL